MHNETIHPKRWKSFVPAFAGLLAITASAADTNLLSASIDRKIIFDRDVRPIFEQSCFSCHGPQKPRNNFRLDERVSALRGGDSNTNDVVPGHSDQSKLIQFVAGLDPDTFMPPRNRWAPLTPAQINVLRTWIDQGAAWGTNAGPDTFAFSIEPVVRWFDVRGDQQKFRELEGVSEGWGGGAEHFFVNEQLSEDKTLTVEGHALMPEHDIKLTLALDKKDSGFVHGGFEMWRKYYDDTGGYYPLFTPSSYSFNQNLYLDQGRFWIDFGLTPPDAAKFVFGYEYQFRQGTQSTLVWGTVFQGANYKNIYPSAETVDEHTHIFKVDITDDWNGWNIENRARVEIYRLGETRNDVTSYSTGPKPDLIERVNENVHYWQGANTLRVEKQLKDWWLVSGGSLLSRYNGTSLLNQSAVDGSGATTFGQYWQTEGITLRRDARVVSLASLFLPFKGLSLSTAVQAEWTHEEGFGNVDLDSGNPNVPGLFFPFPGTVNANQNRTETSENLNLNFTSIPRTVLFAEARVRQESVGQFDEAANGTTDAFEQRTDALNHFYDARAGFTMSPWPWAEWGGHYRRRDSDTSYNHLVDISPFGGAGYPAFIREREITTDEIEGRLVLRPVFWLNARLTYRWNVSDYTTVTDPVAGSISPGGTIFAGHTASDDYGLGLTFTPTHRFYFSGSFTYSDSRTTTAQNNNPAVVPYRGDIYTLGSSAGFVLDEKTDLNATYAFSQSGYGQNNTAGLPLGIDFTRHRLLVGLTRQITNRLTGGLRYEFSQYSEPSSGNVNNFTAHGIFATFAYRWP